MWGEDPIPTPRLDEYFDQMLQLEASEGLEKLSLQHADPRESQKVYRRILDNRTEEEKIEDQLKVYEQIAASQGKTISQETKDNFRGK